MVLNFMKTMIAVCLCFALSPAALAKPVPPSAADIIQKEGRLVFTNDIFGYGLEKEGTFYSGPTGLCGQKITGHWKEVQQGHGDTFVIEGTWGWVNGESQINDFREMTITVRPIALVPMKIMEGGMFIVPNVPRKLLRFYYCDFAAQKPRKIATLK